MTRYLAFVLALAACALIGNLLVSATMPVWMSVTVIALSTLGLAWGLMRVSDGPRREQLRALNTLIAAWRDGDFAGSIVLPSDPALRELTGALNDLGNVLRRERHAIVQRELLLDTVVQNSPAAFVLCDHGGRVVYHNLAARELFGISATAGGRRLDELLGDAPVPLLDALAQSGDIVLTLKVGDEDEVYHLSNRDFTLQARPHRLHTLRRLTREFSRQEVTTWKNVIRVISHELNNSLGPILSLSDSGRLLLEKGLPERLPAVLATIGERADHLRRFIAAYAQFARLPAPHKQRAAWSSLLEPLKLTYAVRVESMPDELAWVDTGQIEQVLINLIKNALESDSAAEDVVLTVRAIDHSHVLTVADRGSGMDHNVLAQALLPFYSTKRSGTGLGLALSREIVDAHGGRLSLRNRDDGGLIVRITLPSAT